MTGAHARPSERGVGPRLVGPAPAPPPSGLRDAWTRELAGWLEEPLPRGLREVAPERRRRTWDVFRQVVTIHGLAPHLARLLHSSALADLLPAEVAAWLREQDALNSSRIGRMHDELRAILAASAEAGIDVMPLKGALLTTLPGSDAYRRPMADLDLLVMPADRLRIRHVLERLGYREEIEHAPRPSHDVFLDSGGGRIVTMDGEHPDNPRRVEVHVEVKRHLWGWVDDDDLTPALWAGARPGSVLGEPALLPRSVDLFAHMAIHASSDLLVGRGRLVQWLDLGVLAPRAGDPSGLPHERVAYPSLRLAARAMPRAFETLDLDALERRVPARLARWSRSVPLDTRCGLNDGRLPDQRSSFAARWSRWAPAHWRLSVAYGEGLLPIVLARHVATVVRRWPRGADRAR